MNSAAKHGTRRSTARSARSASQTSWGATCGTRASPVPYVLCILLTGLVWAAIAACVVYLMMLLIQ